MRNIFEVVLNADMRWINLEGHIQASIQIYANQIWFNNTRGNFTVASYLYNCTFLLTLWSRFLLEKLTGSVLVKKFPAFYGTQMFILLHSQVPYTCPYHKSRSEARVCFVTAFIQLYLRYLEILRFPEIKACSQSVKDVWELKEVISNTYSNIWQVKFRLVNQ